MRMQLPQGWEMAWLQMPQGQLLLPSAVTRLAFPRQAVLTGCSLAAKGQAVPSRAVRLLALQGWTADTKASPSAMGRVPAETELPSLHRNVQD